MKGEEYEFSLVLNSSIDAPNSWWPYVYTETDRTVKLCIRNCIFACTNSFYKNSDGETNFRLREHDKKTQQGREKRGCAKSLPDWAPWLRDASPPLVSLLVQFFSSVEEFLHYILLLLGIFFLVEVSWWGPVNPSADTSHKAHQSPKPPCMTTRAPLAT